MFYCGTKNCLQNGQATRGGLGLASTFWNRRDKSCKGRFPTATVFPETGFQVKKDVQPPLQGSRLIGRHVGESQFREPLANEAAPGCLILVSCGGNQRDSCARFRGKLLPLATPCPPCEIRTSSASSLLRLTAETIASPFKSGNGSSAAFTFRS